MSSLAGRTVVVPGAASGIGAASVADMRDAHDVNVIGSLAAMQGHYPVAYTTSTWAVRGLAHAAALELGERRIRVNAVHPGFIETAMTASASPAFRDASVAATPLGRVGTPEEVASVVVFLLGDGAAYVTGAEIRVDGGVASHAGAKAVSDALR